MQPERKKAEMGGIQTSVSFVSEEISHQTTKKLLKIINAVKTCISLYRWKIKLWYTNRPNTLDFTHPTTVFLVSFLPYFVFRTRSWGWQYSQKKRWQKKVTCQSKGSHAPFLVIYFTQNGNTNYRTNIMLYCRRTETKMDLSDLFFLWCAPGWSVKEKYRFRTPLSLLYIKDQQTPSIFHSVSVWSKKKD